MGRGGEKLVRPLPGRAQPLVRQRQEKLDGHDPGLGPADRALDRGRELESRRGRRRQPPRQDTCRPQPHARG